MLRKHGLRASPERMSPSSRQNPDNCLGADMVFSTRGSGERKQSFWGGALEDISQSFMFDHASRCNLRHRICNFLVNSFDELTKIAIGLHAGL
jgi:hypothetical protein